MKKLLLLLTIISSFVSTTFAQNAYYDAKSLSTLKTTTRSNGQVVFRSKDSTRLVNILGLYSTKDKTYRELIETFKSNPFITISVDASSSELKGYGSWPYGKITSAGSLGKSLGGVDVTKYAQGISLFLIDRAKQELTVAFFQKFLDFIQNYPEVKILFPNTSLEIGNMLAYQYSQMLPILQESFFKDLNSLPNNLTEVFLMDKYYEKIKRYPELFVVLNSLQLLQRIGDLSPPELIEQLPGVAHHPKDETKLNNLESTFKLTVIFSNSLRTDNVHFVDSLKNYWITPKELYDSILNNQTRVTILLGLIYQQISDNNIQFNEALLTDLIKNKEQEIEWYKLFFSDILKETNTITENFQNILKTHKAKQKPSDDDIYKYINTTIDVFYLGYKAYLHYNPNITKIDDYFVITRNVNNLYINTIQQKYTLAINNAIVIFNQVVNVINDKKEKKEAEAVVNSIASNLKTTDKKYSKAEFSSSLKSLPKDKAGKNLVQNHLSQLETNFSKEELLNSIRSKIDGEFLEWLSIYGVFMANLVDADTPEEVKAAIENAALPVGSSSFKKNYVNNLALNAYLGVNAGNWPINPHGAESQSQTWNQTFRLTAPIGVTWTPWPLKQSGSISLFIPIIDVGAIVDYQLNSTTTTSGTTTTTTQSVDQKIYLSNIFSPGAYLVYGMAWNIPISIGFGGQYGPGLIKMNDIVWEPTWRLNFFLAVDIPIFNLHKGKGLTK